MKEPDFVSLFIFKILAGSVGFCSTGALRNYTERQGSLFSIKDIPGKSCEG